MVIFFKLIGIIIIAIGIEIVYDARKLVEKFFNTRDINTATRKLKIAGSVVAVLGSALVIFIK